MTCYKGHQGKGTPPATQRPRPHKVNKTCPVRDPDEVFLSNRRWSSASHTGSGNSERDDGERGSPSPFQPPEKSPHTPAPNSQPSRHPTPTNPKAQQAATLPNSETQQVPTPTNSQTQRLPTPTNFQFQRPPTPNSPRSSITPPPSTQPHRPPTPLSSPSSGSDYEEDARAAGMRRDQIAPKWRKPTIEEQDALDDENFEQEVQRMRTKEDKEKEEEDKEEEDKEEEDKEEEDKEEEDEDDEGETHKAGPIPLEAKERAFECYKTFMQSIEAIAKETEKPVSSLLKLVGLGGVKLPRGTTKWSAFQAYYGVYGEEKKPED
ncbi:hypothetical protein H0H92_010825, partial [Tricholoma furcatifolium]